MRRDKIILILGIVLVIIGITLLMVLDETSKYMTSASIILSIGIAYIPISFVTKIRIESGALIQDERSKKLGSKAIGISWFITLLLLCTLIILDRIFFITLETISALNIVFATLILSYSIAYFYYRNRKV